MISRRSSATCWVSQEFHRRIDEPLRSAEADLDVEICETTILLQYGRQNWTSSKELEDERGKATALLTIYHPEHYNVIVRDEQKPPEIHCIVQHTLLKPFLGNAREPLTWKHISLVENVEVP